MKRWLYVIQRYARALLTYAVVCLTALTGLGSTYAWACQENAMVVFDASGSMALFRDGRPKIDIAREASGDVLPDVTRYRPTGLVTYSGGRGPACTDVYLRVRPKIGSSQQIASALANIQPNGATPLSDAVHLAADTLKKLKAPGIIVLVTDGLENCDQDACVLSRQLKSENAQIRVHVISFFLHGTQIERLKCLTQNTGGTYASTNSLDTLRTALHAALSCNRLSSLGSKWLSAATYR